MTEYGIWIARSGVHEVNALSGMDVAVLSSTARPDGPGSSKQLYVGEEIGCSVVGDVLVGAPEGTVGDADIGGVDGDTEVGTSV